LRFELNKICVMMENLRRRHNSLIRELDSEFSRYLSRQLPWNERLIGIKGSRGVGKTTLLLQHIKQNFGTDKRALYASLDDLYFSEHKLIDFADEFSAKGGTHLFLDEVHKYPNWASEIKNIYDYQSGLHVVFTGSSPLEILNSRSDLSRRALSFKMQGLSFREFLEFRHGLKLDAYSLEDILLNHEKISSELTRHKPLKYFDDYLKTGYFPFFNDSETLYYKRLTEVMNLILEIELPTLRNVEVSKIPKIKQLLYIISQSVPFKPNISALAQKISLSRNTLLEYIYNLNESNVLNIITKDSFGISALQKPEKIYLENTNLIYAFDSESSNVGNVRETFFLNQVSEKHVVTYSEKADFKIDDKYTFEIGGKNKGQKQISHTDNAYIVKDSIEVGYENQIPLWLFGFLY